MKVAIIGGGAAGFFAALSTKTHHPNAEVVLFEKSKKLLAKVKVSGGGRCNVTNGATDRRTLLNGYPRGQKLLKRALRKFDNHSTQAWFESRGVELKTEADGRVFPVTDDSQTIIDCLLNEAEKLKISVLTQTPVDNLIRQEDQWLLGGTVYDKVIIATGGSPKPEGLQWLADLGHSIELPVPSLFTFNMPKENITKLMGLVAPHAKVRVQGTKLSAQGPLLITHWGMSGPAILKLSAWGARDLAALNYQFKIQVNWTGLEKQSEALESLQEIAKAHSGKQLTNFRPLELPERLWQHLLIKSQLGAEKRWGELGKKGINKLIELLSNDIYVISGKTTFKEEFVTCGGVSLSDIHPETMQSRVAPNLYFAGEVMDVDGITGGFNFQAAWTTGFIAGQLD